TPGPEPAAAEGKDVRPAAGLAARPGRLPASPLRRRGPALGRGDDPGVPRAARRAGAKHALAGVADLSAGIRAALEGAEPSYSSVAEPPEPPPGWRDDAAENRPAGDPTARA